MKLLVREQTATTRSLWGTWKSFCQRHTTFYTDLSIWAPANNASSLSAATMWRSLFDVSEHDLKEFVTSNPFKLKSNWIAETFIERLKISESVLDTKRYHSLFWRLSKDVSSHQLTWNFTKFSNRQVWACASHITGLAFVWSATP